MQDPLPAAGVGHRHPVRHFEAGSSLLTIPFLLWIEDRRVTTFAWVLKPNVSFLNRAAVTIPLGLSVEADRGRAKPISAARSQNTAFILIKYHPRPKDIPTDLYYACSSCLYTLEMLQCGATGPQVLPEAHQKR